MQNWSGVDQNNIIIGLWITDIKTTKTGTGNPLKDLQYVYATGKQSQEDRPSDHLVINNEEKIEDLMAKQKSKN